MCLYTYIPIYLYTYIGGILGVPGVTGVPGVSGILGVLVVLGLLWCSRRRRQTSQCGGTQGTEYTTDHRI